ncbi:MAG: hypothetical protein WC787_04740 [Patescibacteria group bacterium]|jgi:excisionase family DNA binding protein
MQEEDFLKKIENLTLSQVAKQLKLSKSYIRKLIDKNYIRAWPTFNGSEEILPSESIYRLRVLAEHPEYKEKVLNWNPSSYYLYSPELIEYYPFHDFIDRYCWLIKLFYAENSEIKKGRYRLDRLFQNFLKRNSISIENISQGIKNEKSDVDKSIFHLQKGWYNEIARSIPLNKDFLNVGTKIPGHIEDATSVAWNITQTYYSVYEYTNAVDFLFCDQLDTVRHKSPTSYFDNMVLDKVQKLTFQYPLALSSKKNLPRIFPSYTKWKYASYPRDRSKRIQDIDKDVVAEFIKLGNRSGGRRVSLVDFLHDFRVWANYTGIETIIQLQNGYLLDYLYRNLCLITFFIAGASEILMIAKMGEIEYRKVFDKFVNEYIFKQPNLESERLYIPLLVRHRIYHHMGILKQDIPYTLPDHSDPVSFLDTEPVASRERPDAKEVSDLKTMKICEIAKLIIKDWEKIDEGAKQYLEAMLEMNTVDDRYGLDSGSSIISYFLSNARGWTGATARRVKKELASLVMGS